MPSIEFMLPLNVLKGLMIRMEDELRCYKQMALVFQIPNDDRKLLIIG